MNRDLDSGPRCGKPPSGGLGLAFLSAVIVAISRTLVTGLATQIGSGTTI